MSQPVHLGDLSGQPAGDDREPGFVFDWFGEPVRVNDFFSDVELIDLIDSASTVDAKSLEGMVVLKRGFEALIWRDDFARFWRSARQHGCSVDALTQTFMVLIEAVSGRPTQRPSGSSDGPPSTATNSTAASSSQAPAGGQTRPDLVLLQQGSAESQARLAAAMAAAV